MTTTSELTPIWKALSDPTRRRILDLLRARSHTTGDLCAQLPEFTRFAVMKHLAVLEEAELIVVRAEGRERWNHLNVTPLQQIYERWLRPYEAHWAASLWQLKHLIEQPKGEATVANQPLPAAILRTLHVEQEITINGSPAQIFQALTHDISAWWGAPYLRGDAVERVILEARVGGRLYEVRRDGGAALYATVTAITPNQQLELTGPIGMGGAIHSVLTVQLEPQAAATRLKLTHHAIGDITEAQQTNYGAGWQDLFGRRLKAFVETGERLGLG